MLQTCTNTPLSRLVVLQKISVKENATMMKGIMVNMGYWPSVIEVKMAGYWPRSIFACLWTETESRSINSPKQMRSISSHLDQQAWSINDLLYGFQGIFYCGTQRVAPSGPDNTNLGSQSQCRIWLILPAHRDSHIIKALNEKKLSNVTLSSTISHQS